LLPADLTPTERQILAEAVVESATGERRILGRLPPELIDGSWDFAAVLE
jgi:hypothetical protein